MPRWYILWKFSKDSYMYYFSTAAIISYHKFSVFKQYTFIIFRSGSQKPWGQGISRNPPTSGPSRGESASSPLPGSRGCLHSLAHGPSFIFKTTDLASSSPVPLWDLLQLSYGLWFSCLPLLRNIVIILGSPTYAMTLSLSQKCKSLEKPFCHLK